jgi:polyisoprenoid-binding protein YceI
VAYSWLIGKPQNNSSMRALFSIAAVIFLSWELRTQNTLSTENGRILFFSKAPVANVDAVNEKVKVSLNTKSDELYITMDMSDFQFKSEKMEKDAEKKYLETTKFGKASFKGVLKGDIDYQKPGTYTGIARGKLNIHGVDKDFSNKGKVVINDKGQVKLHTDFQLALKDFRIDTPEILGKKMTEENVKVTFLATLSGGDSDVALKKKK